MMYLCYGCLRLDGQVRAHTLVEYALPTFLVFGKKAEFVLLSSKDSSISKS